MEYHSVPATENLEHAESYKESEVSHRFRILACFLLGLILREILLYSGFLDMSAVNLLSVFIALMAAIMATNYPMSVIVGVSLCILVLAKSMTCDLENGTFIECRKCNTTNYRCDPMNGAFKTALSGFSSPISWMILCAFHLGQAVKVTKLGERVSLLLMKYLGGSVIGLGFAVAISELILGPFVPSNTARGGGIVLPVVMSLADSLDSTPNFNSEIGQYLILIGSHVNLLVSSLFITGAAPNPIVAITVNKIFGIELTFYTWTLGAIGPFLICFLLFPFLFNWICSPKYDSENVRITANRNLMAMGSISTKELQLCGVLGISLLLWMFGGNYGIPETFVSFLALITLVVADILDWNAVSSNSQAWDTFFWLSGMIVLAEQLSKLGISQFVGMFAANFVEKITSSGTIAALLLAKSYFILMLFFSSITGHTVALLGPLLAAANSIGSSPWLVSLIFAYYSSLSACLTSFSTGSVVLYFSQGYLTQSSWFKIGTMVALLYFLVYSTVGMIWWKLLSFY